MAVARDPYNPRLPAIEAYEANARVYCKLKGLNPDEQVGHGPDVEPGTVAVPMVLLYSSRWERVARDLREHDIINRSLNRPMAVEFPADDPDGELEEART